MAKLGTLDLRGKSGNTYTFNVYSKDTAWADNVACVYYVSKRTQKPDGNGDHSNIYVGQTEDLKDRLANHHRQECFDRHNCNAVSVYQEGNKNRREQIELDLIRAMTLPCND